MARYFLHYGGERFELDSVDTYRAVQGVVDDQLDSIGSLGPRRRWHWFRLVDGSVLHILIAAGIAVALECDEDAVRLG